ncbi:MAG TPA: B12-binding domain-containing radical SAM protein [Deltaproteobacteria bacterium]|nr:B12-binding domain-containing radical SAM protein [Deltaproteobacteria bacterium]
MRVLLISANTEKINILPMPLGLLYVAAATINKGHDVRVLDLMTHEESWHPIKEIIELFHPHVIGISVRNIDDQNMHSPKFLLEEVKNTIHYCRSLSDAPIILGGAGYSIFPDAVLAYLEADIGIQGEGEYIFPELLERLEKGMGLGGLPGLYVKGIGFQGKRTFIHDLNALNISGVQSLSSAYNRNLWVPFQTRRGCPMNCSYCSTATIEGRTIRKRPPYIAIEELKVFVEQGFHRFFFVDNTFNLPPSYAKEMCRMIIHQNLNITWQSILYPGKVDEDLIRLMAEAGCREVSLGFESGCERILKNMNKRFDPEEIRTTSLMLKKYGIQQMGFLMLGGPGETRESVLESLNFADSLPLDSLKISQGIRIYPYTTLAKIAISEGLISPDDSLLKPAFYMVREIEDWLEETLNAWMAKRHHWIA